MAIERTLSIIKPDAVGKNHIGEIIARFEKAGLKPVAVKYKHLTQAEAEGFYAEHKERGFFADLVAFMTSGQWLFLRLKAKTLYLLTVKSWVQLTRKKRLLVQFVQTLQQALTKMLRTVLTQLHLLSAKLRTSLLRTKSSRALAN